MTPGFRPHQNSPPQGNRTVRTDTAEYPAACQESISTRKHCFSSHNKNVPVRYRASL